MISFCEHNETPTTDHIVVLHEVTWKDYERLLEIRGDYPVPRISYLEGEVELLRPSKDHESLKSYIGHLMEDWCINREIVLTPFGSWTVKNKRYKRGSEADECYIFGREKRDSPHLAIEDTTLHRQAGDLPEAGRRRSLVLAQRCHRDLRAREAHVYPRTAEPAPPGTRH